MGTNKGNVVVLNKFFDQDYSWDNFISSIDDAYDLNDPNNGMVFSKEVIGKINFFQKLTLTLENINETNFPGIKSKAEKLTQLHEQLSGLGKCLGYFGAVSFTTKEPTTSKHNDPMDVIYAQFVGSVTWTIYDEDGSEVHTLNPGDIIYVPKSVMHEVTSMTPRAALSFMFEA
jgi:mannose-6-phosphate isomerase-like protein (cupin superfamily)